MARSASRHGAEPAAHKRISSLANTVTKPQQDPALEVDVQERLLLAGNELGRGQQARYLDPDAHSRVAGVGAVLHLQTQRAHITHTNDVRTCIYIVGVMRAD